MNAMSNLPNHLIMQIIREADGGKITHQAKLKNVLEEFHKPSIVIDDCPEYINKFKNSHCDFWIREFQNIYNQEVGKPTATDLLDDGHEEGMYDAIIIEEPYSIIARHWWGGFHELDMSE